MSQMTWFDRRGRPGHGRRAGAVPSRWCYRLEGGAPQLFAQTLKTREEIRTCGMWT